MSSAEHREASHNLLSKLQHRTTQQKIRNYESYERARSRSLSPVNSPKRERSEAEPNLVTNALKEVFSEQFRPPPAPPCTAEQSPNSPKCRSSTIMEPSLSLLAPNKTLTSPRGKRRSPLPNAGSFPFDSLINAGAQASSGYDTSNNNTGSVQLTRNVEDLRNDKSVVSPSDNLFLKLSPRGKKSMPQPSNENVETEIQETERDPSFDNFSAAIEKQEEKLRSKGKNLDQPESEVSVESATPSDGVMARFQEREQWQRLFDDGSVAQPSMALANKMRTLHQAAKAAYEEVKAQQIKTQMSIAQISPEEMEEKLLGTPDYLVKDRPPSPRGKRAHKQDELLGNLVHAPKLPEGLERMLDKACGRASPNSVVTEQTPMSAKALEKIQNKFLDDALTDTVNTVNNHVENLKTVLSKDPLQILEQIEKEEAQKDPLQVLKEIDEEERDKEDDSKNVGFHSIKEDANISTQENQNQISHEDSTIQNGGDMVVNETTQPVEEEKNGEGDANISTHENQNQIQQEDSTIQNDDMVVNETTQPVEEEKNDEDDANSLHTDNGLHDNDDIQNAPDGCQVSERNSGEVQGNECSIQDESIQEENNLLEEKVSERTSGEVVEQAKKFDGLQIDTGADDKPAPADYPWVQVKHEDPDGMESVYFWNRETDEVTWSKPECTDGLVLEVFVPSEDGDSNEREASEEFFSPEQSPMPKLLKENSDCI
eukprot:gene721-560_t